LLNREARAAGAWAVHHQGCLRRFEMRVFMKCVVVLLFLSVSGVVAQEPATPEGSTGKLLLLRQKSVQKELELGDDVAKKIMDFTTKQSHAARKASGEEADARKKAFEKLAKENDKFLHDTLSEKQGKRLTQLAMQFSPLTHLLHADTVKDLKLSDDQVKKLKAVQTEARKTLVELIKSKDAKGKNEKFAKLHEETRAKIKGVLNDDQEKRVRELAGPEFRGEIVFEEHKDDK
jgi:hypothetical protein